MISCQFYDQLLNLVWFLRKLFYLMSWNPICLNKNCFIFCVVIYSTIIIAILSSLFEEGFICFILLWHLAVLRGHMWYWTGLGTCKTNAITLVKALWPYFGLGITTGKAQKLFMVLCTGMISGSFWDHVVLGSKPHICKAQIWPIELFLQPLFKKPFNTAIQNFLEIIILRKKFIVGQLQKN